jgi:hypothetical protein
VRGSRNILFPSDPIEYVSFSPHLKKEKDPFPETLCFLVI